MNSINGKIWAPLAIILCAFVGSSDFALKSLAADQVKGKATIYSDSFVGKKTANGEKYNKNAMTAASPSLPLGSKVLLKNEKTGASAVVKINDRQPSAKGRVADLSKATANKLGVKGTAPVEGKVVSKGN
jgi:rare lipoprotein A